MEKTEPEHMKQEDEARLEKLNRDVESAIKKREAWLDSKMAEYAKVKIGEDIYDLSSGLKLGTVSRLYRYWTKQNRLLDDSLSIEYEYNKGGNCCDNTSRQTGLWFGGKKEAAMRYKLRGARNIRTKKNRAK